MRALFATSMAVVALIIPLVFHPAPAHAGGGCEVKVEKIGSELVLTSPSGLSQVRFGEVYNLQLNILGGKANGDVWDLPGNPTQVRWNNDLKQTTSPGGLSFAVSQDGCGQPTWMSQYFPPTQLSTVWRLTDAACATASVHQTTVWDPAANTYRITLIPTFGNSMTQFSSTFLTHGRLTVKDRLVVASRGDQVTQFDLLLENASLLEMTVEATSPGINSPGVKPTFSYSVNTVCGGWSTSL